MTKQQFKAFLLNQRYGVKERSDWHIRLLKAFVPGNHAHTPEIGTFYHESVKMYKVSLWNLNKSFTLLFTELDMALDYAQKLANFACATVEVQYVVYAIDDIYDDIYNNICILYNRSYYVVEPEKRVAKTATQFVNLFYAGGKRCNSFYRDVELIKKGELK